jgi:hypothetical protein
VNRTASKSPLSYPRAHVMLSVWNITEKNMKSIGSFEKGAPVKKDLLRLNYL